MKSYGTCLSQSDSFHLADLLPCLSTHVVTSGSTYLYVCVHTTHLPYPFVYGWTQVLSVWLLKKKTKKKLHTLNIIWDEGAPWCLGPCPGAGAEGDPREGLAEEEKGSWVFSP